MQGWLVVGLALVERPLILANLGISGLSGPKSPNLVRHNLSLGHNGGAPLAGVALDLSSVGREQL